MRLQFILVWVITIGISFGISTQAIAQKKHGACCAKPKENPETFSLGKMNKVPNAKLVDQDGNKVRFYDLIKGKVVALNFVFTTCKTICPPMGANFVALKEKLQDKVDAKELVMLTVSIDPVNDTPERLKAWSDRYEAGPGWTLLTGDKKEVNQLLKGLKVFTAVKEEHSPLILLGKEGSDDWIRTNGLANPDELVSAIEPFFEIAKKEKKTDRTGMSNLHNEDKDESYFTNVVLVNQFGEEKRLYADLIKDKIVIINPFFAACKGVCPVMNSNMEKIQNHVGEKLGKEVVMLSITVDPENDTPAVLKDYAKGYHAKPGWHFLSGDEENVDFALSKLGKKVENKEAHDSIILVGNMHTRLWKKVNGLASIESIIEVIDSVINSQ